MKIQRIIASLLSAVVLTLCRNIGRGVDMESTIQLSQTNAPAGRILFLKNCAHCHGADAHGNEGPDLYRLNVSDEWIANRIRNGKAGEMTAFAGKLQPSEINALVLYLDTLK
jgi:mono/diheme cytochrome c family protein